MKVWKALHVELTTAAKVTHTDAVVYAVGASAEDASILSLMFSIKVSADRFKLVSDAKSNNERKRIVRFYRVAWSDDPKKCNVVGAADTMRTNLAAQEEG